MNSSSRSKAIDAKIRSLLAKFAFKQQKDILKHLENELQPGETLISQSTLSRSLNRLGAEYDKRTEKWVLPENKESLERERLLKKFITDSCLSLNSDPIFLMFKTKEGHAELVAMRLKMIFEERITGTLAQNNTLVVFFADEEAIDEIGELDIYDETSNELEEYPESNEPGFFITE